MAQGFYHEGRPVAKLVAPGVTPTGGYTHDWLIEHGDSTSSKCTEEMATGLIQKFNFKECAKMVEFFWHGSSMLQKCVYYVPPNSKDCGDCAPGADEDTVFVAKTSRES